MKQMQSREAVENQWRLGFVMPNLHARDPFDFDFGDIAIIRGDNYRLQQIMHGNHAANSLISGFRCCLGSRLPSALIYRNSGQLSNLREAMVDARNSIAVACSSYGWVQSIGNLNNFAVRDTDHFDFYPRWPSENGNSLNYQGPAQNLHTDRPESFQGMTYPYLPVDFTVQPVFDADLYAAILKAWKRVHVTRRPNRHDGRLFRALSIAYEACRVPQAMDNPLYDHGKHCSLWVSAFETLAHKEGMSGPKQVIELIGRKELRNPRLSRKFRMKSGTKPAGKPKPKFFPLNAIQRLYSYLHRARNAFLHGNHLSVSALIPKCLAEGIRLLDVAPLVFHTALEAHFIPANPTQVAKLNPVDQWEDGFRYKPVEEAFLRSLT
jgi:hypothetical protein